jgi:thioredoxin
MFLDQIMDYESNPSEWIYKGDMPSLIDFYADWCRPCRITSPILEELAQEYEGKIKVYKIDVQAEQELASIFGIQSIPSFLYIPKDDTPVMSSGIAQTPEATKEMFRKQIDEILLNKNNL